MTSDEFYIIYYKMGCYDTWCPICGGPLNRIYNDDLPKDILKLCKWMTYITILLPDGKTIMGAYEVHCNSTFRKGKKDYDLWFGHGPKLFSNGVPLHDDCYRFSKKKLKFDDFINKKGDNMGGFDIKGLDYNPIKKYWKQMFDTETLLKNKNSYLLESPLKSKKNANRITKNIKKLLKTTTKKLRPSPSESATKFPVGTKKKGGNGKMWKVVKTKSGV